MATSLVIALTVALFSFSAAIKLGGRRPSLEIRDHLGIAPDAWRTIGRSNWPERPASWSDALGSLVPLAGST